MKTECSKCDGSGFVRDPVLLRKKQCSCLRELGFRFAALVLLDKKDERGDEIMSMPFEALKKEVEALKKKRVHYEIIEETDPRFVSKDDQMVTAHENAVWEDVWPDYSELGFSVRNIN